MMSKSFYKNFIFLLTTVDILILPYFPFFAINTFFPLMFFSFFLNKKKAESRLLYGTFAFIFLSLLSTIISGIFEPYFLSENIKRFIQFLMFFIVYFYYYDYFLNNDAEQLVIKISDIFFSIVFLWTILYIYNIDKFLYLKSIFNKNDGFIEFLDDGTIGIYRFSYIWTDPNNIVYAILGFLIFAIINLKIEGLRKILYILVALLVCVASMSTMGWFILIFCVSPIIFYYTKVKFSKYILLVPILMIIAAYKGTEIVSIIFNSEAVQAALDRYELNNLNSESGGSRFVIWTKVISYYDDSFYKYFFIGDGYQLHNNGNPIKPHNGILLVLFGYGLPALLLFLYLFFSFKFNRRYLFMIPFFLCFLINVMIGETKLFMLYLFLLSYARAIQKKE